MKKAKKWVSLILVIVMLLVWIPAGSANADLEHYFGVTVDWYGSDPTPVTVYLLEQDGAGLYQITHTWTLTPSEGGFIRSSKSFYVSESVSKGPVSDTNAPFFAISRNDLNGKWYCDKWDWNNAIYQPGTYAVNDGTYHFAHFYLTSSLRTDNSITINRQWNTSNPNTDIYYDIYRYSSSLNKYYPWTGISMPAASNSVTVSGLYDGTYYVSQNLPNYTTDNSDFVFQFQDPDDHNNYTYHGLKAMAAGGSNASVTFIDSYNPPPTFNINIAGLSGGTIEADKSTAKDGDTVNLTVTPNAKMQFKNGSLKYTDSSGEHAISGTSFVMPSSAVTVSGEFEAKHYNVNIGSLSGGRISANPSNLLPGDTVNLTISPETGKRLKDNTLKYVYGTTSVPILGTSFRMPEADVTVTGTFETPVSIVTSALPEGMESVPYNATLTARDGTSGYIWSAENLPDGLSLDENTGVISGTPTGYTNASVVITVEDNNGETAAKTLDLHINSICGNGGYLIKPDTDTAYSAGVTTGGLPTMTASDNTKGFLYFSVEITKEKGHAGNETLLFTQTRNGQQIAIVASEADYDSIPTGKAAFNVRPGDVITAYIVDEISNDSSKNPTIL